MTEVAGTAHEKVNDSALSNNLVHDRVASPDDTDKIDPQLERSVLWRLDILLVPLMFSFYFLSFLDRANIGNARVAGLQKDLKITDTQYSTAITLTYVPYIVAEMPSNLLMRKVGPKRILPVICFLWGVVASSQSRINSYSGLLACRFFLGLCEGGILPGIILFLSSFYRPHELQLRVGLMFSGTALSGAFSGLLAAAIAPMDGIGGLQGWQWIFLLEGLFTICFAVFAYFVLPDTPARVLTLNSKLSDYLVRRLNIDNRDDKQPVTARAILSALREPHLWAMDLALFCNGVTLYGLAYFTPSIVATMKYSSARTQLMTVPPFALAFVFTLASSLIADRFRCRGATAFVMNLFGIIGFSLFLTSTKVATRYVGLCFAVTGVYAMAPSYCSWIPNNTAGRTRRATAIAMAFISTNTGGIVSTWIYPRKDTPLYLFAAKFNLAISVFGAAFISLAMFLLHRKNQEKVTRRAELLRDVSELSYDEQLNVLGDHHPDFRYTL